MPPRKKRGKAARLPVEDGEPITDSKGGAGTETEQQNQEQAGEQQQQSFSSGEQQQQLQQGSALPDEQQQQQQGPPPGEQQQQSPSSGEQQQQLQHGLALLPDEQQQQQQGPPPGEQQQQSPSSGEQQQQLQHGLALLPDEQQQQQQGPPPGEQQQQSPSSGEQQRGSGGPLVDLDLETEKLPAEGGEVLVGEFRAKCPKLEGGVLLPVEVVFLGLKEVPLLSSAVQGTLLNTSLLHSKLVMVFYQPERLMCQVATPAMFPGDIKIASPVDLGALAVPLQMMFSLLERVTPTQMDDDWHVQVSLGQGEQDGPEPKEQPGDPSATPRVLRGRQNKGLDAKKEAEGAKGNKGAQKKDTNSKKMVQKPRNSKKANPKPRTTKGVTKANKKEEKSQEAAAFAPKLSSTTLFCGICFSTGAGPLRLFRYDVAFWCLSMAV